GGKATIIGIDHDFKTHPFSCKPSGGAIARGIVNHNGVEPFRNRALIERCQALAQKRPGVPIHNYYVDAWGQLRVGPRRVAAFTYHSHRRYPASRAVSWNGPALSVSLPGRLKSSIMPVA